MLFTSTSIEKEGGRSGICARTRPKHNRTKNFITMTLCSDWLKFLHSQLEGKTPESFDWAVVGRSYYHKIIIKF
jgi:hypothetical protein